MFNLFKTAGGKSRIVDAEGRQVEYDGKPIEVDDPTPAPGPVEGPPQGHQGGESAEVAALRRQVAELQQAGNYRAEAARKAAQDRADRDGAGLADSLVASGKILPAMKGAIATTYAAQAAADIAAGKDPRDEGSAAHAFAASFADAPSHGLLGQQTKANPGGHEPAAVAAGKVPPGVVPGSPPPPADARQKLGIDRASLEKFYQSNPRGQQILADIKAGKRTWEEIEARVPEALRRRGIPVGS